MEIVKFEGNSSYIIGMAKEKEQLFVFYGLIDNFYINSTVDEAYAYNLNDVPVHQIYLNKTYEIKIPLLIRNNKAITFLKITTENEYIKIKTVLEDLL